jgi:transcriptional regulator with XRE-family HTH domain
MSTAASRPLKGWLDLLSERLVRHRLNRNLTQSELARAAGVSLRTLARLEGGEPIQFESFLRTLIALGLEDGLERLVPDVPESPIEQLKRAGRRRRRASGKRKIGETQDGAWTWDEEA